VQKACIGCHGAEGNGGLGPVLRSQRDADLPVWEKERILPLRSPYATTVWDYINRGMPIGLEGTLTADEVYSLTAYLLYINDVIAEDEVLDAESLPKVSMPIGDEYGKPREFKLNSPRLEGYPY
jgi:cytochrome c